MFHLLQFLDIFLHKLKVLIQVVLNGPLISMSDNELDFLLSQSHGGTNLDEQLCDLLLFVMFLN